ncbi:ABC transporter substrate-binding protein [Nitratidesulfovibrio liaohensis]|uniref:Transporter substrate-binding domain-containing protein n=1 Tax=Nitratidesulfovibrio liaohensis TaxID=2604158 RepID=A0ABY9R582_9BACT|nr:transporter substrate-binding domain-containing protein [Nitratidesulfovibrio liaohensis]WMW65968.1 transporter substrate-binding domain-containing protein [Nitratidesulfovibrio liaohensis]
MKRQLLPLVAFAAYMLVGGDAYPAPVDQLSVCYIEHPPYYFTEDGQPKGILVAKVKAVLEAARIRHEFKPMPAKRALERVERDPTAISIGWFRTEERERRFIFSRPIYTNRPPELLVLSSRVAEFRNHRTFAGLMKDAFFRLGTIVGHSEGEYCDAIIATHAGDVYHLAGTRVQLVKMLRSYRIDGVLVPPEEVDALTEAAGIPRDEMTTIKLDDIPAGNARHIIFNKNTNPGVIATINAVIQSLEDASSGSASSPPLTPATGPGAGEAPHRQAGAGH